MCHNWRAAVGRWVWQACTDSMTWKGRELAVVCQALGRAFGAGVYLISVNLLNNRRKRAYSFQTCRRANEASGSCSCWPRVPQLPARKWWRQDHSPVLFPFQASLKACSEPAQIPDPPPPSTPAPSVPPTHPRVGLSLVVSRAAF